MECRFLELLKVTKKGLKYRVLSEIGAEMTAVLDLGKEVPLGRVIGRFDKSRVRKIEITMYASIISC